jgi:hypothetical protein
MSATDLDQYYYAMEKQRLFYYYPDVYRRLYGQK